jgi:hypothetical protein
MRTHCFARVRRLNVFCLRQNFIHRHTSLRSVCRRRLAKTLVMAERLYPLCELFSSGNWTEPLRRPSPLTLAGSLLNLFKSLRLR